MRVAACYFCAKKFPHRVAHALVDIGDGDVERLCFSCGGRYLTVAGMLKRWLREQMLEKHNKKIRLPNGEVV